MINGLVATGKYSFKCFGGAVKHDNYDIVQVNPDFIIKPTDGFGDPHSLRMAIAQERPDVLLLFTDPRFFTYVFGMEDEIHQVCPIAYNHIWDNPPLPQYNLPIYEATDLVNCINYPIYEMIHPLFPEKTNYIPHAVPRELFHPLPDDKCSMLRRQIIGAERKDHFIVTFVSRNARRKRPSDVIMSFKLFLEDLQKTHGHTNASLIMHADPLDPEGPNLHHVIDMSGIKNHIIFSKERVGFAEMNALYNISDTCVCISCNEGFGLSMLEAKMCGKPVIGIKTGGVTRQVEDWITGEQYGVALTPEVQTLVGNQGVPYIYEDYVSNETIAKAMMKIYELGSDGRKELGKKCIAHVERDYNIESLIKEWDRTLTDLTLNWKKRYHRWSAVEL